MLIPRRNYGAAALLITAVVAVRVLAGSPLPGQGAHAMPIVVVAEVVHGRMTYTVDSKPVARDLLDAIGVAGEKRGWDCPVIALVDVRARIDEIGTIDGVAGKAGFQKPVRFFVFNKESGKMSTVEFGPSVPFTTNPPID